MHASILTQLDHAGPYRVDAKRLESLRQEADALKMPCFDLTAETSASTAAWLRAAAATLHFPTHFGANFDALYDCLCDRASMPQAACVLIFRQLSPLGERDSDHLIAVLQAAADEWRTQQRPLWALFAIPTLELDPLPPHKP